MRVQKQFHALASLVQAQSSFLSPEALEQVAEVRPYLLVPQKWGLLQYMIEHRFQANPLPSSNNQCLFAHNRREWLLERKGRLSFGAEKPPVSLPSTAACVSRRRRGESVCWC